MPAQGRYDELGGRLSGSKGGIGRHARQSGYILRFRTHGIILI